MAPEIEAMPAPGRRRVLIAPLLALLLVAAVVLAPACGSGSTTGRSPGPATDLSRASSEIRQAYHFALAHRDLFEHLPCYCGCADLVEPHRSLADCFITRAGGFEPHAASCGICVQIALEAGAASERGLGHAAVRALIDENFAGVGPATDTSYPPD